MKDCVCRVPRNKPGENKRDRGARCAERGRQSAARRIVSGRGVALHVWKELETGGAVRREQGTGAACGEWSVPQFAAGIGRRCESDGRSAAARGPNSACAGDRPCGDRPSKARINFNKRKAGRYHP